jgi:hypothetical protein
MEYLIYFVAGFLGVFIHCVIKANSLMTDARRLKVEFTIKDYLTKDFLGVSLSIAMIFVWLLIFGEVGLKYPKILDYIRVSFIGMGLFGSVIIQAIFNRGKNYIRNKIDETVDEKEKLQAFTDSPIVGDRPKDR